MIHVFWLQAGGLILKFDAHEQRFYGLLSLAASIEASLDNEFYYNTIALEEVIGAEWKDYRAEVLGVVVGKYSDIGILPNASQRTRAGNIQLIRMFPYTTVSPLEYPDHIVRPCRVRLYYKRATLFAERIMYGNDKGLSVRLPIPRLVANNKKFPTWAFDPQFLHKDLEKITKYTVF